MGPGEGSGEGPSMGPGKGRSEGPGMGPGEGSGMGPGEGRSAGPGMGPGEGRSAGPGEGLDEGLGIGPGTAAGSGTPPHEVVIRRGRVPTVPTDGATREAPTRIHTRLDGVRSPGGRSAVYVRHVCRVELCGGAQPYTQ